jgi:hypothetical protein
MAAIDDIHSRERLYKANPLRRTLWWLGGGQCDVLEHPLSAGSRWFIDGLGMMVGTTAVADGLIAGTNVHTFLFHGSVPASILIGAAWGAAIIVLDRLLLVSMDALHEMSTGARVAIGAFRVGAVAIIAFANAVPAECLFFSARLDVQMAENRTIEMGHVAALLDASYSDVPGLVAQRAGLQKAINDAETAVTEAAKQKIAENDGTGGSGRPGDGVRHREKEAEFQRLQVKASQTSHTVYPKIASLDKQIAARESQREKERESVRGIIGSSDDPMTRIEALWDLKADPRHGPVAIVTGWIFTLVTLLFGVSPVLAKLLRAPSEYDALVVARRKSARAHWRARSEIAGSEKAAEVDIAQLREAAKISVVKEMAESAVEEALRSPDAAARRRNFAEEILKAAVPAAQDAVRDAFSAEAMAAEVRAAAGEARRREAERVVRAEQRRRKAHSDFDRTEQVAKAMNDNQEHGEHEHS